MIPVAAVLSVFLAQAPAPKAATPAPQTKAATPAATQTKAAAPAAAPAKPAVAPAKPAAAPAKPVTAAPKPAPAAPKSTMTPPVAIPDNDTEKTVYALGLMMSQTLAQFDLTPRELELIKQAVSDAATGKTALDLGEWQAKIGPLAQERRSHVTDKEKEKGKAYLAAMAKEAGATTLDGGIILKHIVNGTGDSPAASDTVKVHYRGNLIDKTEFDSSYKRNEPAEFPLTGVIKCWTEGVQHIKVGGRALLGCPPELAYGDQGRPSIPGGATLIFEIELLEIKK